MIFFVDLWRDNGVIYGEHCKNMVKNKTRRIKVMSPDLSNFTVEILDALEDEYGGIVIDPNTLPPTSNAFASALRASLSNWRSKVIFFILLQVLFRYIVF